MEEGFSPVVTLMSLPNAAIEAGVHPQTLRKHVRDGKIKAVVISRSRLFVEASELTRYRRSYSPKKGVKPRPRVPL